MSDNRSSSACKLSLEAQLRSSTAELVHVRTDGLTKNLLTLGSYSYVSERARKKAKDSPESTLETSASATRQAVIHA